MRVLRTLKQHEDMLSFAPHDASYKLIQGDLASEHHQHNMDTATATSATHQQIRPDKACKRCMNPTSRRAAVEKFACKGILMYFACSKIGTENLLSILVQCTGPFKQALKAKFDLACPSPLSKI